MTKSFQGFGPQHDRYQRMRRRFPSPMAGLVIDRAAERLTQSAVALSDLPILRLARLLHHEDLTRSEHFAALDELRRRREHAVNESDVQVLAELIAAKVVRL